MTEAEFDLRLPGDFLVPIDLKNNKILHLSTNLCSKHMHIITKIKRKHGNSQKKTAFKKVKILRNITKVQQNLDD